MGLGGVRRQTCPVLDGEEEDDAENLEGVCQSALPPFEPLVLWQDQNDPSNKIEACCIALPHIDHRSITDCIVLWIYFLFDRLCRNWPASCDRTSAKGSNSCSNALWVCGASRDRCGGMAVLLFSIARCVFICLL